ncbi:MAG: Mur ligase domain-containing protein [Ferruginibacter sp.]
MIQSVSDFKNVFFIGVAGVGMSAIAQWLAAEGKNVSGSDRYFLPGVPNETREKLEAEGIRCFLQDGEGITEATELVVVSTAIEDTVMEVQKAKQLNIPIIRRSALLAMIAASKRTIAVGGTSGKSTTSAMLFQVMEVAGLEPGIISGAGLVRIMREGKIGNAKNGKGEWLIIEADESDGSIVQYKPEVGLLLNIDKDHQEIDELMDIFGTFKKNTSRLFVVNQGNALAKKLCADIQHDFSSDEHSGAGYIAGHFQQEGMKVSFEINGHPFSINTVGRHNMENALAAVAVAHQLGVDYTVAAEALKDYEGIYRRHQLLGEKNGITVIDDYAHNPAKCAASIIACQPLGKKVVAWFQPHGYGPTRFLRTDFVKEIAAALREQDEIWMSEIFYAGGTAVKDISSNDLVNDIRALGKKAFFVEDRKQFLETARPHLEKGSVLLLMGARDPGLEAFSQSVFEQL